MTLPDDDLGDVTFGPPCQLCGELSSPAGPWHPLYICTKCLGTNDHKHEFACQLCGLQQRTLIRELGQVGRIHLLCTSCTSLVGRGELPTAFYCTELLVETDPDPFARCQAPATRVVILRGSVPNGFNPNVRTRLGFFCPRHALKSDRIVRSWALPSRG